MENNEHICVKLNTIKWDSNAEGLPNDMQIDIPRDVAADYDDHSLINMAVDEASNQTGWCISSMGSTEVIR